MENASKALIMAGGMLLAILIVSLLIYAWSLFSEYQTSRDSLAEIEDTAKFNEQFANYDRDDVQGYELLSLLNKIIDYNERMTTDTVNDNSERYKPISIKIDLVNETERKKLTYNDKIMLFESDTYEDNELTAVNNSGVRTSFKNTIISKINTISDDFQSESDATNMAKSIGTIFLTEDEIKQKATSEHKTEEMVKIEMLNTYNKFLKKGNQLAYNDDSYNKLILKPNKLETMGGNQNYATVCQYYEYMQFKRAIFKCEELTYDTTGSGRVSKLVFKFTGNIH